jgi:hypothetical protein
MHLIPHADSPPRRLTRALQFRCEFCLHIAPRLNAFSSTRVSRFLCIFLPVCRLVTALSSVVKGGVWGVPFSSPDWDPI